MSEVSANRIHKGLIALLSQTFKRRVYGDEIRQGFQPPCFFVSLLSQSEEPLVGRRFKQTYRFDVHYFPAKGREDAFAMADELYNLLAFTDISGDLYRGTKMQTQYTDDVLHFFVQYDLIVIKQVDDEPSMNAIAIRNRKG